MEINKLNEEILKKIGEKANELITQIVRQVSKKIKTIYCLNYRITI